ncbi:Mur ligase [Corynascus similis CBS 632.67]
MAASSACEAYDTALARLAQLQSNRAITSLFDTPAPAAAAGDSSKPPIDLNSLAIPEMLDWLRRAGYTPTSLAASPLRFVHVAGTKGKGSVSALVASILHQYRDRGAGRVGLYTSPHVVSVRERIVLDCEPISQDKLARYTVTAAVVTQLGIDHVGMLGNTVEKIAWHKSGVFKPGVKAFTRRLPDDQGPVMEVLRERAREKGAVLVEVADEEVKRWGGVDGARLQGPFQKYNMAVAVHAAREHLLQIGVELEGRFGTDEWSLSDIPPEFVKGLREASLRGRCEVLRDAEGIEWHVDGAHTDDSLAGVGRWFAGRMGDTQNDNSVRVLLFNQQERDPGPLLKALLSGAQKGSRSTFSHAIFTRNEEQGPTAGEERDLSTQSKAQAIMQAVDATTVTAVHSAVRPAVEHIRNIAAEARKEGKSCMVLATGSFHLVGAVLKTIEDHVEY